MRRDLSAIDRDIGQDWSRIIQEAFKHGIDCNMIFGGLLEGKSVQDIYEESSVQNYLMGTRLITPDGRVFRYAKVGSTICYASAGVKNWKTTAIGYTAPAAVQSAGDFVIKVANQTFAKDELKGGYVVIYNNGDTIRQNREIVGNTLCSSSTVTITLKNALSHDVAVNGGVEVIHNPYVDVRWINDGKTSVVGVPARNSSVGKYIWIQTWGVLCISPGSATPDPGADAEERQVQFDGAGNILCYADGTAKDRQEAGFIMENDAAGAGPPFIMLQISP